MMERGSVDFRSASNTFFNGGINRYFVLTLINKDIKPNILDVEEVDVDEEIEEQV